ncbi:MAG: type II toxin-antitoxin system Phd/YefM family antitoxin [Candidatus Entotheonellia bacterium]
MKEVSSPEAKTHFGALIDMAQREPVTIHKKGRAVAVMLSIQDFETHEAVKFKLLQQAIDDGLPSGLSDRSMDELIADAEQEAAEDDLAGNV